MEILETKLYSFLEKPSLVWFGLRFRPSAYDEVFHLCVNHLMQSFDGMKVKNFEVRYGPGEPAAEFYRSVDMLEHLLKSIMHAPRFPWKAPALWVSVGVLYFLFTGAHGPLFWWLVLVETILMVWTIWG